MTAISTIFFTFKFNFIKLLPCAETLLITNAIHVPLMEIDSPMQFTHSDNFRPMLCNFLGKCKEIQSKLHNIALKLLQ